MAGRVRGLAIAIAACTVVVGVPADAGAGEAKRATPAPVVRMLAAARAFAPPALGAGSAAPPRVTASSTGDGWASVADPVGDVDPRADVTNVAARLQAGRIRLGLTLPDTPDPTTDDSWQFGGTFAAWLIDTNLDNVADYDVFVLAAGPSHFLAGVATDDGSSYLCDANASYRAATHTFSAAVSLGCLGNPVGVILQGGSQYDTNPYDAAFEGVQDSAPDEDGILLGVAPGNPTLAGGYVVDGFGGMRAFGAGGSVSAAITSKARFGFDIVRGLGAAPDGGHAYVVDGYGGLHGVGLGPNSPSAVTHGGPYWPGWDIARGVAVGTSARGGYVVDAFGGLHPFGIGERRAMPRVVGGAYWVGWDITRGIATLPDGRGGWVVDGFGGLHWFSLGTATTAPTVSGGPYWPGQDRARGVALAPDGSGGYIVDRAGRLYPFGIDGRPPPRAVASSLAVTRGVATVPTPVALPAIAPNP